MTQEDQVGEPAIHRGSGGVIVVIIKNKSGNTEFLRVSTESLGVFFLLRRKYSVEPCDSSEELRVPKKS